MNDKSCSPRYLYRASNLNFIRPATTLLPAGLIRQFIPTQFRVWVHTSWVFRLGTFTHSPVCCSNNRSQLAKMEASRGPPRVKNKAPGKSCFTVLKTYMLTFCKPLSKSVQSSCSVRLSTDKSQDYRHPRNDSQISKSFMNFKAAKGRNSRTMCEGIG